ncbi:uncharacterized protein LOC123394230 isoform X6 [Mustela putorius furo]|uniref:Uncharacterized protein LOC123394230 isoform X6 n=1 Tax=Mustela putorius furo TaxID=9669 RepID=A0A8U0VAH1_MUSPF|nr:uncharacterized protein LOC123394230 isoform X6 [Mustela putorius furo]
MVDAKAALNRWCFETKVTGPRWQHPTRLASVSSVQIQVQNIQECDLCHLPGGCISQLQSPRLAGEVGVVAGTALQNGWCFEAQGTWPTGQNQERLASVSSVQMEVQHVQECDRCRLAGARASQWC